MAVRAEKSVVTAFDFEEKEIYHPSERPGYSAWVCLWPGNDDEWFTSFVEKRRAPNHDYRPIPLDFYESMTETYGFQGMFTAGAPNIRSEIVIMRTTDGAASWQEVGRSPNNYYGFFGNVTLPNGDILRSYHTSYASYYEDEVPSCAVDKSTDMGNTWVKQGTVMSGYFTYLHRMKRLSDGTIVGLGFYTPAFGPGRARATRSTVRAYVRTQDELMPSIWVSRDDGKTWSAPIGAFRNCPNIWEPDFVELPSGDLLLLNSSAQTGPQVRQYCRRSGDNFVPEPVFDVVSGLVPETVTLTPNGLLVGSRRNNVYTCSKDEGATWHKIKGLTEYGHYHYQPMIACMEDGRLLCVWHCGCDSLFARWDEYIGQHVFRLEGSLPETPTLTLRRELDSEGKQYINAYTARLTVGDTSIPGRKICFSLSSPYGSAGDRISVNTDADGIARVAFPEWDNEIDALATGYVSAEFSPEECDTVTGCKSDSSGGYLMTARRNCSHGHKFFAWNGMLFAEPGTLTEYPDLPALIEKLAPIKEFSAEEAVRATGLAETAIREMLSCLVEHRVLRNFEGNRYRWPELTPPISGFGIAHAEDDFV